MIHSLVETYTFPSTKHYLRSGLFNRHGQHEDDSEETTDERTSFFYGFEVE